MFFAPHGYLDPVSSKVDDHSGHYSLFHQVAVEGLEAVDLLVDSGGFVARLEQVVSVARYVENVSSDHRSL